LKSFVANKTESIGNHEKLWLAACYSLPKDCDCKSHRQSTTTIWGLNHSYYVGDGICIGS